MISIEVHLEIIATEAVESMQEYRKDCLSHKQMNPLPPIDYRLELIETSDGSLSWVE